MDFNRADPHATCTDLIFLTPVTANKIFVHSTTRGLFRFSNCASISRLSLIKNLRCPHEESLDPLLPTDGVGAGGPDPPPPLKNQKHVGLLGNTRPDPL